MNNENNDTRAYVVNLLETSQERKRKIALLHYELEHPAHTSETEMIGAMALGHGAGGSSHTEGHISDKTLYIALNYQDRAKAIQFFYEKELTQGEVEKLMGLSAKTVRKLKKEALDALVVMYEFISDFS